MKPYLLFLLIYFLVVACIFPISTNATLEQILYSGSSLVAIIMGFKAHQMYGGGKGSHSLIIFMTGIGVWLIGDIIWWYQNLTTGITVPSIADFFYLLGYPLFFIAITNEILRVHISWKSVNKAFMGGVLLMALLFITVFSYFSIFLAYDKSYSIIQNIVTLGYGIGDIILIIMSFFLLTLVNEYRGGKVSRCWLFLFLGFVVTLLADMLYALYVPNFQKQASLLEAFSDSLYVGGYLLWAAAFYYLREMIRGVQAKLRS